MHKIIKRTLKIKKTKWSKVKVAKKISVFTLSDLNIEAKNLTSAHRTRYNYNVNQRNKIKIKPVSRNQCSYTL